jgi:ABC-type nitrate/sulfonate/bicarbonate transport system permease component
VSRHLRWSLARIFEAATPLALIVIVWQLVVTLRLLPAFLVPSPASVLAVLVIRRELFLQHTLVTTVEIVVGFALAVVVGIPLGWLIVSSRLLERIVYPLMVGSQAVPKVALGPLLVLALGYGVLPKVLLALLVAFFPIAAGAAVGFRSLDRGGRLPLAGRRVVLTDPLDAGHPPADLPEAASTGRLASHLRRAEGRLGPGSGRGCGR